MSNDSLRDEKFKERFIRWQKITLDQLSFLNNLIIVTSSGILTFEIYLIFPEPKFDINQMKIILFSSICLSFSVMLGIITAINRLIDFKKTKELVRDRWKNESKNKIKDLELETDNLGRWTWNFFWGQLSFFLIGVGILAILIILYILNYQV
jgi:hypothetical protein